jgi:hypothetical protein
MVTTCSMRNIEYLLLFCFEHQKNLQQSKQIKHMPKKSLEGHKIQIKNQTGYVMLSFY